MRVPPAGVPFRRKAKYLVLTIGIAFTRCTRQAHAASNDITVVTPSETLEAGAEFTVEWEYADSGGTTGDLNAFTIELHYCGDDGSSCSGTDACGTEYVALCERADGCMDSDGSYNVQLPEDAAAGQYAVKVGLAADTAVFSCSEAFDVSDPEGGAVDPTSPSLVTNPPDYVEVGDAFTARWVYDDGTGSAEGTFEIDLYLCDDNDCNDG